MRSLAVALVAATALPGQALPTPAFAQQAKPSSKVEFGKVPTDGILSGDLYGLTATNSAKDSVGEIKDLVIDHNRLVGYVLSVGGFLGVGEHYVVVRSGSVGISYDTSDKKWKAVVNASKDELKAAPEFKYSDKLKH